MSAEKLYREVRAGRVKLDQLNDDGKAALKGYMEEKDKRDREALVGGAKKVKSAVQKVGSNVASKVKTASRANRPQPMLTARPSNAYSLDDVILAGQGDRAAEVRLKGTAWETMPPEQRAALKPEIDSRARELTQKRRDEDWGRNAPVLGDVIRGLDWLADKTKPAADVALDLYTPGGGLAAVNTMTKGAAHGVAKMFPGLANSAGGRVASTALMEAAVGAPLGVSNALARDMEATPREIVENAIYGAGGGALLGGAGRGVGELTQWGRNQAREGLEGILRAENAIEQAAKSPAKNSIPESVGPSASPAAFPKTPAELADQALQSLAREFEQAEAAIKALDERFASGGSPSADETRQLMELMDRRNQALGKIDEVLQNPRFAQVLPEGVQGRVAPGVQAMAAEAAPASAVDNAVSSTPAARNIDLEDIGNLPKSTKPKKTIQRRTFTKNLEKYLGLTIRTGRTGFGDDVLGVFKVQPEVIRTAKSQEFDTIFHEVGHQMTKKHGLKQPQYERELLDLMDKVGEHDYKQYPRDQWMDEGIAEYMRILLQNPQRARTLAPKFTAFLEQKLPENVRKGIVKAQRDTKIWLDQGDAMRFRGKITEGRRTEKGTIKDRAEKAYASMVDRLTHLDTVEKEINALAGGKKELADASRSLYKKARLTSGTPKKAQWIVREISNILKPLEKSRIPIRDFRDFATALRAADLERAGYESGFTVNEIKQTIRDYDGEIMRKVQSDLIKFQNKLLDMGVEGETLTPEAAAAMKKMHPNYVPMYRDFDEELNSGLISGKGFADLLSPFKRIKGSSRDVRDPLESIIRNVFAIVDHIEKNKVGLELSRLSKVDGAGRWIEKLDGAQSVRNENIVTVWEKGQKVQYQLEPELYRAIKQMDEEASNAVIKMLSVPTQILRGGATLAPEFILRNPIRDQFQAFVVSNFGYNPIIDLPHGMFRVLKGKLWKNGDKYYDQWVREGGGYGNMHSIDRNYLREQVAQLKDDRNPWVKRTVAIVNPKQWLKLLQVMSEFTEEATKVGEFARGIRKGATPEEAAFQSRDLMDFARMGNSIKQANRITAFLNANIQGKDRIARAFIKHPVRSTIRAVTGITLPTIGFYLYNKFQANDKQKETLREAPQWMRDTFFLVAVPGTDVVARIPKPFDLAPIFSNIPDNIMRWMDDNDPQAWDEFSKSQAIEMLNIPYMLTALTPILENMTNYDFFTKGPIVPRRDQGAAPEDQFGNNTSLVARELGEIFKYSPYKIDNLISGFGATMGRHATSGIDAILEGTGISSRPPAPAKTISELPVINAFAVNNSGGGKSLDDFYKMMDEINKRHSSYQRRGKGDKSIEDEKKAADKISREISKLNSQRREVQASFDMTPKQKRNYLDELDQHIRSLAREGLKIKK